MRERRVAVGGVRMGAWAEGRTCILSAREDDVALCAAHVPAGLDEMKAYADVLHRVPPEGALRDGIIICGARRLNDVGCGHAWAETLPPVRIAEWLNKKRACNGDDDRLRILRA